MRRHSASGNCSSAGTPGMKAAMLSLMPDIGRSARARRDRPACGAAAAGAANSGASAATTVPPRPVLT